MTRLPMGLRIALSEDQMKSAGIPDWMSPDDVAECLDRALLTDDSTFAEEIRQFIEEYEAELSPAHNPDERTSTYAGEW